MLYIWLVYLTCFGAAPDNYCVIHEVNTHIDYNTAYQPQNIKETERKLDFMMGRAMQEVGYEYQCCNEQYTWGTEDHISQPRYVPQPGEIVEIRK